MPKKKEYEEGSVEYALQRIKEINEKTKLLRKEKSSLSDIQPNDIYLFEISKSDSTHKSYYRYHGKCSDAGLKDVRDWGYNTIPTEHFTKDKNPYVSCQLCNTRLDEKAYEAKVLANKKEIERKRKIFEAYKEEQIILGTYEPCSCARLGKLCPNRGQMSFKTDDI